MQSKKLERSLKTLLVLLSALTAVSCAGIKVYDHIFCAKEDEETYFCAHTLTSEQKRLTKAEYDAMTASWGITVSTPLQTITQDKKTVEELCNRQKCSYDSTANKMQINVQAFLDQVKQDRPAEFPSD